MGWSAKELKRVRVLQNAFETRIRLSPPLDCHLPGRRCAVGFVLRRSGLRGPEVQPRLLKRIPCSTAGAPTILSRLFARSGRRALPVRSGRSVEGLASCRRAPDLSAVLIASRPRYLQISASRISETRSSTSLRARSSSIEYFFESAAAICSGGSPSVSLTQISVAIGSSEK